MESIVDIINLLQKCKKDGIKRIEEANNNFNINEEDRNKVIEYELARIDALKDILNKLKS